MVKTNGETHKPSGNMETAWTSERNCDSEWQMKVLQGGPKNQLSGKITILPEPE